MRKQLAFGLAVVLCGANACSSSTETAATPLGAATIQLVRGGGQKGFAGDSLTGPIVIRVTDATGAPIVGRTLRTTVTSGGGSASAVATASDGTANVSWRLGPTPGAQQIAVSVGEQGTPLPIVAVAIAPSAADVIILQGASPQGTIRVLFNDAGGLETSLHQWPDTLLRLPPRDSIGPWQEVVAFQAGHPPVSVVNPWTSNGDTVRMTFGPPISVPLTLWITRSYDSTYARAQVDLARTDELFQQSAPWLRVGTVRVIDATGLGSSPATCTDARPGTDTTAINVYYVATQIVADGVAGITCAPNVVIMGRNVVVDNPSLRYVLAHELGHALSLPHADGTNVMTPGVPGITLTAGQFYQMRFNSTSALNAVMHLGGAAVRNCQSPFPLSYCVPVDFDWQR